MLRKYYFYSDDFSLSVTKNYKLRIKLMFSMINNIKNVLFFLKFVCLFLVIKAIHCHGYSRNDSLHFMIKYLQMNINEKKSCKMNKLILIFK